MADPDQREKSRREGIAVKVSVVAMGIERRNEIDKGQSRSHETS